MTCWRCEGTGEAAWWGTATQHEFTGPCPCCVPKDRIDAFFAANDSAQAEDQLDLVDWIEAQKSN